MIIVHGKGQIWFSRNDDNTVNITIGSDNHSFGIDMTQENFLLWLSRVTTTLSENPTYYISRLCKDGNHNFCSMPNCSCPCHVTV